MIKIIPLSENDADHAMYVGYCQKGYGSGDASGCGALIGIKGRGCDWGANYDFGDSGYGKGSACGHGLTYEHDIKWSGTINGSEKYFRIF